MKKIPHGFYQVEADYVNPGLEGVMKKKPKYYRFDKGDSRFYFSFKAGVTHAHISITSLADMILPKGAGFYNWLKNNGQESEEIKYERATFGSIFHREALRPIKGDHHRHGKGYDFDYLDEHTAGQTYINMNGEVRKSTVYHMLWPASLRAKSDKWEIPFKKGLMAWFLFLKDRVEWIEYMEGPIGSAKDSLAGTPDLVCGIKFGNGAAKRAIVDIKSFTMDGKTLTKSFYDSHEFQLEGLKYLWNLNFPDRPVDLIFNWAPNDWKTGPTYTLENQTHDPNNPTKKRFGRKVRIGSKEITVFQMLLESAKAQGFTIPPQQVVNTHGKFTDVKEFDYNNHWLNLSLFK
jgi:hypothetical protein